MAVRILVGDCRDVLRGFGAGEFDCCITDPPYGETSLDWDKVCEGWLREVARVLKPAASIWVFGSMRFLAPMFGQMRAAGFEYSQDIVWEKHNGSGFLNDRFRRVHEHAVMFYRGAWADVYHHPQVTNDATARTVRKKEKPAHWHGATGSTTYISEDGGPRLARSVMRVRSEHGRAVHPTQKPIDLLVPLVRYSCPVGGNIIDPFGGSASTAIAAQSVDRNCVCIEVDSERAQIGIDRLHGTPLPLFGESA